MPEDEDRRRLQGLPHEAAELKEDEVGTTEAMVPVADHAEGRTVEDALVLTGPPRAGQVMQLENYSGASLLRLDHEEAEQLAAAFPSDALDVKPTGEVFVSQVHYRRRLNKVFGPGQWALVPRGAWTRDGGTMMREYVLYARGHFIAEAVGECEYQESNDRMTWADAAEGCKSNALTRACKDLGIASECWDRLFATNWRNEHCIQVWVQKRNKPQWRRFDQPAFYGETGPTDEWMTAHPGRLGPQATRMQAPATAVSEDEFGVPLDANGQPLKPEVERAAAAGAEPNPSYDPKAQPAPARTAAPANGGPKAPCPKCQKPAYPSKFPKPGATHFCGLDKLAFEPGVSA
jgi:hypothetical protein